MGNGPIYQKIDSYEAQLGREIEQRRQNLATADELYRRELSAAPLPEPGVPAQLDRLEQPIRDLDAQEQELRSELRQIQQKVTSYTEEMNAEELGRKLTQNNSGRPGTGPRYQFAKQQREVYATQGADRERELRQLEAKRSDLRSAQARLLADAAARATQVRDTVQNKRDELKLQVEVARNELALLEGSRLARISEFRQQALSASDFQKQKDDPLSRMTAYQELKNDPKDGATITLFSWMTKFLVIFLEIVPVVAKMFFSPPSVYAARLQAEVEGGREAARIRVELEGERKVATVRDEIESEREAAEISVLSERERATAKVELKLLGERPAATARADGEHEGAISLAADERERTVAKLRTEAAHQPPAVRPEMETKRGKASSFATSTRARAGRVNPV